MSYYEDDIFSKIKIYGLIAVFVIIFLYSLFGGIGKGYFEKIEAQSGVEMVDKGVISKLTLGEAFDALMQAAMGYKYYDTDGQFVKGMKVALKFPSEKKEFKGEYVGYYKNELGLSSTNSHLIKVDHFWKTRYYRIDESSVQLISR